jgi:hypothetical protein
LFLVAAMMAGELGRVYRSERLFRTKMPSPKQQTKEARTDASHGADTFLTFACSGYTPQPARSRFHRKLDYGCTAWVV